MSVEKPCTNCVVSACCSKRCRDYAVYIYENNLYKEMGVDKTIQDMPYEKAINHILKCEDIFLYIQLTENLKRPCSSIR